MNNIGILDPTGVNLNPLTEQPYSESYKDLALKWSTLPAYKKINDLIKQIKKNQVTLIISSTGSGKTVLVPKILLHILDYNGKIGITLPKQIIAKSAAEYAAKTLDVVLGTHVGYQYKGSDKSAKSDDTKLLYATDGTIVARLMKDPLLNDFDGIIIDEAHERKVQIDFLLYLLKQTLIGRPDFKLIVMSATVDENIFKKYYSQFKFGIVNIGGERAFPITSIFLKKPITEKEYIETGLDIIKKILKETTTGDILFFVTSVNETLNTCKLLGKGDDYCIEVYAGINAERQELAQNKDMYKDKFNKKRKVVIATNVAESSLTIDGIKFVIDSGLELHGYYDPKIRARILEKGFITHAQATQRMGRAGRVEPGTCYHLYTEEIFNKMKKFPEPAIKTSNIWSECLNLLNLPTIRDTTTLSDILSQFIEPPQKQYVDDAITQLKQLDLINADNEISDLGILISQMQMDPSQAVAVYTAWHLKCAKEVVAILCMIDAMKGNFGELFVRPENIARDNESRLKQVIEQQKKAKQKLAHETGDHLSCLNIYTKYINLLKTSETEVNDFIYSHFLRRDILDKAKIYFHKMMGIVHRLLGTIEKKDMGDLVDKDLEYRILASLFSGFKINEAVYDKKTHKYNTSHIKSVGLNPNSFCVFFKKEQKKLMYYELFGSNGRVELVITSNVTILK